ncbi:hypothetical protein F4677DRAFT_407361 [Hypoxylon crocopeplum]|nr:hypothetical protein F4677DRAFT_407361 [Hypoxylon crocopeplum]
MVQQAFLKGMSIPFGSVLLCILGGFFKHPQPAVVFVLVNGHNIHLRGHTYHTGLLLLAPFMMTGVFAFSSGLLWMQLRICSRLPTFYHLGTA